MKKLSVTVLVLLAIISAVIAYIYFTKSAGNIPHFFPGYLQGSAHKHTKHGLAFIALTVVLLIAAWMMSGTKRNEARPTEPHNDVDQPN